MRDFAWPVRVYHEDTDAGGVVYYANYLKFMERARTEWLRHLGFEQDRLIEAEKVIFAVRQLSLDYLKPARFNDRLEVKVILLDSRGASISLRQTVADQAGQTLCQGTITVVCLDADPLRPKRLPSAVRKELKDAG